MEGCATLSDCGTYRYVLGRSWAAPFTDPAPRALWVCLNPSTADADDPDPSLTKMIGFSDRWGCTSLEVVNLFAFRSKDRTAMFAGPHEPGDEMNAMKAIGPEGNVSILDAIKRLNEHPGGGMVICGWGSWDSRRRVAWRANVVLDWLKWDFPGPLWSIGPPLANGAPLHPLMAAYAIPRTQYRAQGEGCGADGLPTERS